jgi:S1-C subfamily serine protease
MGANKSIYISRFETWLTPSLFYILLAVLIAGNLFVWFFLKTGVSVSNNSNVISVLSNERDKLKALLEKACGSAGLVSVDRNSSKLSPDDVSRNQAPSVKGNLVDLLQSATVMVSHSKGSGSGFFIDSNTIVTNRHVVEGINGEAVQISSRAIGSVISAKVISASQGSQVGSADFALLRIDRAPSGIKALSISERPLPLQKVFAVGFPGSAIQTDSNSDFPSPIFTSGDVSAIQPQPSGVELVIHTADISPGSSGGALFDRCGSVVGVNTFVRGDENRSESRRLFALSADSLRKFLDASGQKYSTSANCTSLNTN